MTATRVAAPDVLFPSPVRGLFEVAFANFTSHAPSEVNASNETRGPLLLISGTADHTVPDVTTRASLRQYRESGALTEFKLFEGRGHSLTIDSAWRDVASACLQWLHARQVDTASYEPAAQQIPAMQDIGTEQ